MQIDFKPLVAEKRDLMIKLVKEMVAIPAVNPNMGGSGEYQIVQWLAAILKSYDLDYRFFEVPDSRVAEGKRLNLITVWPGKDTTKTLWFFAHTDTVSPGDLSAWQTDPFCAVEKDGRIYGLGAEDNGQGLISSLMACIILKEQNIIPGCNIGFIFAADEETGSKYGLKAIADSDFFGANDEAVVPDGGNAQGTFIEIAEKSMCALQFNITGKQAHASMPDLAINAFSIGMRLAIEVEDILKARYSDYNALYNPPYSTFEYTQKFANVASNNIIPGKDSFIMNMRVLPEHNLDEILTLIRNIAGRYEYEYKVKVDFDLINKTIAPPPTAPDAPLVQKLAATLAETGLENIILGGIGGGTCAEFLRRAGLNAVVWSSLDGLAHQPNEYVIVDNLIKDTNVFLKLIEKY